MMHKILAVLAAAVIASGIAYAGSVNYTSSGTSPFRTTTDGSSNNLANITVWDSVAGATGWTITSGGAGLVDVATSGNNLYNAITSPIPTGGNVIGFTSNDPCQTSSVIHPSVVVNYSASGLNATPLIAGLSGKKTYICQIVLQNNAADSMSVFEATTGTSCATPAGTFSGGMWGGTTAATGFNFLANSGISIGNGSYKIANTTVNQNDVCITTSAATQVSGRIEYVQQ